MESTHVGPAETSRYMLALTRSPDSACPGRASRSPWRARRPVASARHSRPAMAGRDPSPGELEAVAQIQAVVASTVTIRARHGVVPAAAHGRTNFVGVFVHLIGGGDDWTVICGGASPDVGDALFVDVEMRVIPAFAIDPVAAQLDQAGTRLHIAPGADHRFDPLTGFTPIGACSKKPAHSSVPP